MRPLHLELCAFGSYPEREQVDFRALAQRGTFLVTGPTGSGKTTVFDAMVFALYGDLPGQRKGEGEARSHHAAPEVATYVELEFEVEGRRYRVRRSPQQERPAKRGGGTTSDAASAVLAELLPDGSTRPIASKVLQVNAACTDLVGLTSEQFQRVVLLPQGKFSEFLVSKEGDREPLLAQLFGGRLYTDAVQWMKDRTKSLDSAVRTEDTRIEHHLTNARDALVQVRGEWLELDDPTVDGDGAPLAALGIDALRVLVHEVDSCRADRERSVAAIEQLAADAHARQLATDEQAARFDDAVEHRAALDALEAERAGVEAGVAAADRSVVARPVVDAAAAVDDAETSAAAAHGRLDALRDRLQQGFEALALPMPEFDVTAVSNEVTRLAEILKQQRATVTAADTAGETLRAALGAHEVIEAGYLAAAAAAADLSAQSAELASRRVVLVAAAAPLAEFRHRVAAAVADHERRGQLAAAEHDLIGLRSAADGANRAHLDLHARYVATQASRLADELRAGEPCPVCGSAEHPSPARPDGGVLVEATALREALDAHIAADQAVSAVQARVDALRTALGELADSTVEELAAALDGARAAETAAAAAAAELQQVDGLVTDLEQQRAAAAEALRRAELDRERSTTEVKGARDEAERLAAALSAHGIVPAEVELRLAALDGVRVAVDGVAPAFEDVQRASAMLAERRDRLAEVLATSGLPDVEVARSLVLDPTVEHEHRERRRQWHEQHVGRSAKLEQLVRQGIPVQRPDTAEAAAAAASASDEATRARSQFVTVVNAVEHARTSLDQAADLGRESAALRHERDTARRVLDVCTGQGKAGRLERWVLGHELGRVVAAASVHLAVMSNHRYRLDRAGGLELAVFDAHTGRSRSTSSLSGGEQFQASLALALGLADVVGHGGAGSGKTFEALFVDEGFGSLDPDSLDLAIETLSGLQAGGRMVGAITHVEAMKQRLNPGIEVSRRADGRGSTLRVVPL